jgi:hypothetical protein
MGSEASKPVVATTRTNEQVAVVAPTVSMADRFRVSSVHNLVWDASLAEQQRHERIECQMMLSLLIEQHTGSCDALSSSASVHSFVSALRIVGMMHHHLAKAVTCTYINNQANNHLSALTSSSNNNNNSNSSSTTGSSIDISEAEFQEAFRKMLFTSDIIGYDSTPSSNIDRHSLLVERARFYLHVFGSLQRVIRVAVMLLNQMFQRNVPPSCQTSLVDVTELYEQVAHIESGLQTWIQATYAPATSSAFSAPSLTSTTTNQLNQLDTLVTLMEIKAPTLFEGLHRWLLLVFSVSHIDYQTASQLVNLFRERRTLPRLNHTFQGALKERQRIVTAADVNTTTTTIITEVTSEAAMTVGAESGILSYVTPIDVVASLLAVAVSTQTERDEASHRSMSSGIPITPIMHYSAFSGANQWPLLFSATRDGDSIAKLHHAIQAYDGATLLLVHTSKSEIFGAFVACPWSDCTSASEFFGNSDCFLFTYRPEFRLLSATGHKSNFVNFVPRHLASNKAVQRLRGFNQAGGNRPFAEEIDDRAICFGGREQYYRIRIDGSLTFGTSLDFCATYQRGAITPISGMEFKVANIEIWGMLSIFIVRSSSSSSSLSSSS